MLRVFLVLMLCLISVCFCPLSSAQTLPVAADDQPTTMSKEAVLALLPEGCVLAEDIPTSYGEGWNNAGFKQPYDLADTDADGRNELVVAYYTEPPARGAGGSETASFYERARVRVYHWDGNEFSVQWESEGWGSLFRGGMNPDWSRSIKNAFTETWFAVRDINGDKIPDILFTRGGYGAMGRTFEVWSWDRESRQYKQIVDTTQARLVDADHDGVLEIICDRLRGMYGFTQHIQRWDQAEHRYVQDNALTEAHQSLFMNFIGE